MLVSSAVERGLEYRLGQTKDYKIGICFSAKHAPLRSKNKDWLARNQENVSEWSGMSLRGLSKADNIIISLNVARSFHDIHKCSLQIVELALYAIITQSLFRFAASDYPFVIFRLFFIKKGQNAVNIIGNSTLHSPPPPPFYFLDAM
jgi:hypothetical protein